MYLPPAKITWGLQLIPPLHNWSIRSTYVRRKGIDLKELENVTCESIPLLNEAVNWVLTVLPWCWKIPQRMDGASMFSASTNHIPRSHSCAFKLLESLERGHLWFNSNGNLFLWHKSLVGDLQQLLDLWKKCSLLLWPQPLERGLSCFISSLSLER